MKKILLILAVIIVVLAILCGIFIRYVRTRMILDGPGMTHRAIVDGPDGIAGLYWSRTTSYQHGCFSFSVFRNEDGNFRLSGFCWSESKRKLEHFDVRKMSGESVVRLRNLLDSALTSGEIVIPPEEDPDAEKLIALDAPSGRFELVYADDRGTVEYASPTGTLREELYALLARESGMAK